MKVLVLVPDLSAPGGVASFFKSLEGQFKQHEVVYFTRGSRAGVGSLKQVFIKCTDYLRFAVKLIMGNFDLVHVNTSLGTKNLYRDPWFVMFSKLFGKKVVVFFHGWKPDCINNRNRWLLNMLLKTDAIIVLANEFGATLRQWGFQGKVAIMTTVVSNEMASLLNYIDNPSLVSDKEINILFLSRIEIPKGIYESIDAVKLLQQRFKGKVELVIAGDGSELVKVKEYVDKLAIENVRFCGYVSGIEKAKVLMESDIYLLPSYSEGMPISVLEAMLAGSAVVTRATGGLVDFFTESMGRITVSKDPEVFAGMLYDLISNPGTLSDISSFNANYAKQNFTVGPFIAKLEEFYAQI